MYLEVRDQHARIDSFFPLYCPRYNLEMGYRSPGLVAGALAAEVFHRIIKFINLNNWDSLGLVVVYNLYKWDMIFLLRMTYLIKWWDETSVIKSLMDENSQESHININLILIYPLNNGAKIFHS